VCCVMGDWIDALPVGNRPREWGLPRNARIGAVLGDGSPTYNPERAIDSIENRLSCESAQADMASPGQAWVASKRRVGRVPARRDEAHRTFVFGGTRRAASRTTLSLVVGLASRSTHPTAI
jgi:hypothetical protein